MVSVKPFSPVIRLSFGLTDSTPAAVPSFLSALILQARSTPSTGIPEVTNVASRYLRRFDYADVYAAPFTRPGHLNVEPDGGLLLLLRPATL